MTCTGYSQLLLPESWISGRRFRSRGGPSKTLKAEYLRPEARPGCSGESFGFQQINERSFPPSHLSLRRQPRTCIDKAEFGFSSCRARTIMLGYAATSLDLIWAPRLTDH